MSHKKSKQSKPMSIGLQITCIFLALVIIAAAVLTVLQFCTPYKPSGWFKKNGETDKPDTPAANLGGFTELSDNMIEAVEEAVTAGSSLVVTQSRDGNEIGTFAAARMSKETLMEEYGVSATADSGITLKISNIKPVYATDKTVTWSVVPNPNEGVSGNYRCDDYITVHPSADTLTAVVVCEGITDIQLDIVATFNSNPELKLTCTCDFLTDYGEVYFGLLDTSMNPARDTREVNFRTRNVKSYEPVIYNMSGTGQYLLHESSVGTINCTHTVSGTYTMSILGTATQLVPISSNIPGSDFNVNQYRTDQNFMANTEIFFGLVRNVTDARRTILCDWVKQINEKGNQGIAPYAEAMNKILKVSFSITYTYQYGGKTYSTQKQYTNEIGCTLEVSVTSADISQGGLILQK